MGAAAAVIQEQQQPTLLAGEREASERDRIKTVDAVRLLLEADAAVVQAREEWLAAGDRWAAARRTYELAAQVAIQALPNEPLIVRESATHVRVVSRSGGSVRLERLRAVSMSTGRGRT
ncbi:MAG: hypothetical protein C0434_12820 [Xanthomonadaceae bacterium]|nr:hypothetical protein [Xanthomonadaceae bacterium]